MNNISSDIRKLDKIFDCTSRSEDPLHDNTLPKTFFFHVIKGKKLKVKGFYCSKGILRFNEIIRNQIKFEQLEIKFEILKQWLNDLSILYNMIFIPYIYNLKEDNLPSLTLYQGIYITRNSEEQILTKTMLYNKLEDICGYFIYKEWITDVK
jgi:hypothetical protein